MTSRYVVDPATGCWLWQLSLNNMGYARLRVKGVEYKAHRYYYEQQYGHIPKGLVLDHLCRTSRCVNPAHLEAVSQAENCRRGARTKHSTATIKRIRQLHASGYGYRRISRLVGVPRQTIQSIVVGRRRVNG